MTVKIKKDELLAAVKANREKHKEIVDEAFTKYREMAIAELDSMIAEARAGKRIRRAVNLTEPIDQTKEYDSVIRKLSMSAEEIIEIEDQEFECFVMDNWRWKGQWEASNASYTSKK